MRVVGPMEKLGDNIFFLGRVIEKTARGYSVEANPKYIRDVIAVLGLEHSRPVSTPSVKRTPTTESLVELENEKRDVHRTAVVCQKRADIMYSVKERARKITCPTESDETNAKRIARYLKGVPSAKVLIEINRFVNVYTDSDWAGQHQTCKEHKSRSGEARLFLLGQEHSSQRQFPLVQTVQQTTEILPLLFIDKVFDVSVVHVQQVPRVQLVRR